MRLAKYYENENLSSLEYSLSLNNMCNIKCISVVIMYTICLITKKVKTVSWAAVARNVCVKNMKQYKTKQDVF